MLQLACVQAANKPGNKHVYIALTTPLKYFHYSPQTSRVSEETKKTPKK